MRGMFGVTLIWDLKGFYLNHQTRITTSTYHCGSILSKSMNRKMFIKHFKLLDYMWVRLERSKSTLILDIAIISMYLL